MTQSVASWVAASDETQETALQLGDSKALVAQFSSAVATRSCAAQRYPRFWLREPLSCPACT